MSETADAVDIPSNPASVERVLIVDPTDGATIAYEGPFEFGRDGGIFEIALSVGTRPVMGGPPVEAGVLADRDIETIPDREGSLLEEAPEHLLIAANGERVVASGQITAVGVGDERVGIAADDPNYIAPSEIHQARAEQ